MHQLPDSLGRPLLLSLFKSLKRCYNITLGRNETSVIKSMTGYGRGEAAADGLTVTLELRAVNNRYLDTTVKMPRAYLFAEDAIKKAIQARVGRGKLDVFVNVAHTAGDDMTVTVNEPLAAAYKDALRLMADQLELGDALAMGSSQNMMAQLYLIARFPDVLAVEKRGRPRGGQGAAPDRFGRRSHRLQRHAGAGGGKALPGCALPV